MRSRAAVESGADLIVAQGAEAGGHRSTWTRESMAPEAWKQAILRSTSDATTMPKAFTGLPARVLRNRSTSRCTPGRAWA